MAGLDSYFGPSAAYDEGEYLEDDWDIENEEYYQSRRRYDSAKNNQSMQSKYHLDFVKPKPTHVESEEEQAYLTTKKFIKDGVGIATLITENLLSHPFVVLRRQCQVNHNAQRYHTTPLTLLPVVVRLNQRQGLATLWKGLGSVLLVRGMSLAIEDVISKVTPWPKEVTRLSSLKQWGQHVLLKSITLAVVTPFYMASLVETVQSEIASEKPGIFDVFREGMCRLFSWSGTQKGRMLPIFVLVLPTVAYGLLKYGSCQLLRSTVSGFMHFNLRITQENMGALPRDNFNEAAQDIELTASMFSVLATETVFFPFETILHRIHLQGTRTIIDNLDSGRQVVPILTGYDGAIDCYRTTVQSEGVLGLYKGFGALILQCIAHYALIKVTKLALTHASHLFRGSSPPPVTLLPPTRQQTMRRSHTTDSIHSYTGTVNRLRSNKKPKTKGRHKFQKNLLHRYLEDCVENQNRVQNFPYLSE